MVEITEVLEHSPAARAGIEVGDLLLSIGGREIRDVLDYRFYLAEEEITLSLERGGEPYGVTIKKELYDDIGLGFKSALMDDKQHCKNHCIFCFIDQNPKGLRESLYFKDDDSRLSFLHGNYVTLTNMTERDVERIIEMRFSPINVSVHTMNPTLRVEMMKNKTPVGCSSTSLGLPRRGSLCTVRSFSAAASTTDGSLTSPCAPLPPLPPRSTAFRSSPPG